MANGYARTVDGQDSDAIHNTGYILPPICIGYGDANRTGVNLLLFSVPRLHENYKEASLQNIL